MRKSLTALSFMVAMAILLTACGASPEAEESSGTTEATPLVVETASATALPPTAAAPTSTSEPQVLPSPTVTTAPEPTVEAPSEPTAEPTEEAPSEPTAEPTQEPPAEPSTFRVEMVDFSYSQLNLEAPVGSTVTWFNTGAAPHSATADDGSWDTGLFGTGEEASITFDAPGVYRYYCTLHGAPGGVGMAAVITVTE